MRVTAILMCILLTGSVQSAPPANEIGYAAVDGVETFKRVRGDSGYPWERLEFKREQREARRRGEDLIRISNGGSPVDFIYHVYRLGNTRHWQTWRARGLMGEWGRVGEFFLETPHLVKFRKWHGTSYILTTVLIYTDGAHQPFVGNREFIAEEGWSGLVRPVANPEEGTACAAVGRTDINYRAYDRMLRDEGAIEMPSGGLCMTQGVYLKDIGSQLLANRRNDAAPRPPVPVWSVSFDQEPCTQHTRKLASGFTVISGDVNVVGGDCTNTPDFSTPSRAVDLTGASGSVMESDRIFAPGEYQVEFTLAGHPIRSGTVVMEFGNYVHRFRLEAGQPFVKERESVGIVKPAKLRFIFNQPGEGGPTLDDVVVAKYSTRD